MTVGNFNPVLGTQLSDPLASFPEDSILNLEGNNLEIVYGLRGNDLLSTDEDLTSEESVVLLGGEGNDQYLVRPDSFAVILETGNSNDDTLVANDYKINGDNTYSLTIDERHLYTADLDTGTYALILDWRSNTTIDNFVLADGDFSFQEATAFFDELVASDDENFLGNFTWDEVRTNSLLVENDVNLDLSEIGLSSDTIDAAIDELKDTEANFEETIEVASSGDNIDAELTTDDNSYIYNDERYYYDFYNIDDLTEGLEPGDLVDLNLSSADFNPILMVLDSRGNVIDVDEDGDLTFVVGSGEPFSISVESRNANATGSYDLSVNVIDEDESDLLGATEPIVVFDSIGTSEVVDGSLNANDFVFLDPEDNQSFGDGYSLTGASVGQEIRVSIDADFNAELGIGVFDSDFNPVDDKAQLVNDNLGSGSEQATFTIEEGFDYFISINNFESGQTGSYTLTTEVI